MLKTLISAGAPILAPILVGIVGGLLLKGIHSLITAGAGFLKAHTTNASRKAAIDHIAQTADTAVAQVEASLKPALSEAAGELLASGKLTADGQKRLKDAAVAAVKAQAPQAIATVKEVEGLGEGALNDLIESHVEAAVARQQ